MIFIIVIGCILCSGRLIKKSPEELLPGSFLSVIVFLYPFYCLDMLRAGKYALYAIVFILLVISIIHIIRNREQIRFFDLITPGITVFMIVCAVIIIMTANNYAALWDETRLWAAYPKALWYYEKLQLLDDAIVFKYMRSYPPGMPLLAYFLQSLNSSFKESGIFAAYGIFTASLLISPLKRVGWKWGKIYIPVFALFIILLPCALTSHGGDSAYFYQSLFIDNVLGALVGYGFYTAYTVRLDNLWDVYQMSVVSGALILLKDSGMMFAMIIVINAMIISALLPHEKSGERKNIFSRLFYYIPLILDLFIYFLWQYLLKKYEVVNHVGLHHQLDMDSLRNLIVFTIRNNGITYELDQPAIMIRASFFFLWIIIILAALCIGRMKGVDKKAYLITVSGIFLADVIFSVGFCLAFGGSLPSFERYMSTLTTAWIFFFSLIIFGMFDESIHSVIKNYKRKRFIIVAVVLFITCGSYSLCYWEKNRAITGCPVEAANENSDIILKSLDGQERHDKPYEDVYLFCPGHNEDYLLHQRIYMNLIGTVARIKNNNRNMQIIKADEINEMSESKINKTILDWEDDLFSGYDYLYVLEMDDMNTSLLQQFTNDSIETKTLYVVDSKNHRLKKCKE